MPATALCRAPRRAPHANPASSHFIREATLMSKSNFKVFAVAAALAYGATCHGQGNPAAPAPIPVSAAAPAPNPCHAGNPARIDNGVSAWLPPGQVLASQEKARAEELAKYISDLATSWKKLDAATKDACAVELDLALQKLQIKETFDAAPDQLRAAAQALKDAVDGDAAWVAADKTALKDKLLAVFKAIDKKAETMVAEETSAGVIAKMGMGIGLGVNVLDRQDVITAGVQNGRVSVTDSERSKVQIWMESHYLFGGDYARKKCGQRSCLVKDLEGGSVIKHRGDGFFRARRFFHGPFIAVQVSDGDELLKGAALGYMVSLKREGAAKAEGKAKLGETPPDSTPLPTAFNIGIGISTSKIGRLGNGLKEGQTLADGEQVFTRNRNELGVLILFSVNVF
ncbi:MAG: hypothetical protein ACT4PZ_01835 [Panacagrimonas sp.]